QEICGETVKYSLQSAFFCDILRMLQKNTYAVFSDGAASGKPDGLREQTYGRSKPNGGKKHECYFNETAFRSRCTLRTPDKKMEPENGSVHLHREKWYLHHRPAEICRNGRR